MLTAAPDPCLIAIAARIKLKRYECQFLVDSHQGPYPAIRCWESSRISWVMTQRRGP
jgi:hypothetical protein